MHNTLAALCCVLVLKLQLQKQKHCPVYIVAYLCHARTVTLKHIPTITQQQTKWCYRCFLRAVTSCTSHRLLPGNRYKHLDNTSGEGLSDLCSDISCFNSSTTVEALLFFCMSDQGFIGETVARLWVVLGERQPREICSWRELWTVFLWREDFCVIFGVWDW
jgi:hypothetical protein